MPAGKFAVQVVPQLIPPGELETEPVPLPASCTCNWTGGGTAVAKFAATVCDPFKVREQDAVPLHAPLQPVNVSPAAGEATSVTVVPLVKLPEQTLVLHVSPAGVLCTVPEPVRLTVSEAGCVGETPSPPQPKRKAQNAIPMKLTTLGFICRGPVARRENG